MNSIRSNNNTHSGGFRFTKNERDKKESVRFIVIFGRNYTLIELIPYIILIISIIVGAGLRFAAIDETALFLDEVAKVEGAEGYLNGEFYRDIDHPAIEKYLIAGSMAIFGDNETTIRLPNLLLSVTVILLVFLIGKKMYNPWVGAIAAFFISFCNFHIGYSIYAKEDPALTFFLTLAIFVYVYFEDPNKRLIYTSIVCGLATATKLVGVIFPLIFLSHSYLTGQIQEKRLKTFLKVYVITFIVFALASIWTFVYFLHFLYGGLGHWAGEAIQGHRYSFFVEYHQTMPVWYYFPLFIFIIQIPITVLGSIGLGTSFMKRNRKRDLLIILWLLIPFVFYSLLTFCVKRYAVIFIPPFVILCALGVERLYYLFNHKNLRLLIGTIICAAMIITAYTAVSTFPEYREYHNGVGEFGEVEGVYGQETGGFAEKEMFEYLRTRINSSDIISADIHSIVLDYHFETDLWRSKQETWNGFSIWVLEDDGLGIIEDIDEVYEKNVTWIVVHSNTLNKNNPTMNYLRDIQYNDNDGNFTLEKITYWHNKPRLYAYHLNG